MTNELDDRKILRTDTFKYFESNSSTTVNLYDDKIDFYDIKSYNRTSPNTSHSLPTLSIVFKRPRLFYPIWLQEEKLAFVRHLRQPGPKCLAESKCLEK